MTLGQAVPVELGEGRLSVAELVRVARGARIALAPEAVMTIRESRAVVEAALAGDELVYGLNTGLGHLRDERVPREVLRDYQDAIVAIHAGGLGPALPVPVVRAAMAARVNGIVRGGAGTSLAVAETLVAMLNAGVHPIVPAIGSVGASDLMHMAAIAEVAVGRGRALHDGVVLPGGEALRRVGIEPLRMEPKDGLALISANGVAIGDGALVVDRAAEVAELADVVGAASLEAAAGNPSITEPIVGAAKGIVGQRDAASHLRALLSGSARWRAGAAPSVQDALSFRVMPQVHGALREFIAFTADAVEAELNAMDDNPLVSITERRLISNGNFHPIVLALAFDALRPALAHVGQLSDRRMGHVWGRLFADPATLTPEGMRALAAEGGAPLLRYAAATRSAALRVLAAPVSLDIVPLDLGVEDHATNAPESVRRTDEALDALEDILAVELLTAWTLLTREGRLEELGVGTAAACSRIGDLAGGFVGRAADELHAAVRAALRSSVLPAARAAVTSASSP